MVYTRIRRIENKSFFIHKFVFNYCIFTSPCSLPIRSVVSDYIDLSEKQIVPLCHQKPWFTFPDSFLPLEKDNWYNIQQTTQGLGKFS